MRFVQELPENRAYYVCVAQKTGLIMGFVKALVCGGLASFPFFPRFASFWGDLYFILPQRMVLYSY